MEFEYGQVQGSKYDCLMFDLDDTLYPLSSGIAAACRKNIGDYMVEKLGIEASKVPELSALLYKTYGTTMAGLRAIGYNFDYDDYHSFVHGRLPYERLKPDPVLRNLLQSLPFRKVIFTNGDKIHAAKALSRLGLEDCFEGVICFETLNPPSESSSCPSDDGQGHGGETTGIIFDIVEYFSRPDAAEGIPKSPVACKPSVEAMEQALRIAETDPRRTIFFDDSVRNIQSGKQIGLHTVLVGTSLRTKGADYSLENIHNLREALPELWEGGGVVEKTEEAAVRYAAAAGKVAIETSVTA